jgi:hypothetical protein
MKEEIAVIHQIMLMVQIAMMQVHLKDQLTLQSPALSEATMPSTPLTSTLGRLQPRTEAACPIHLLPTKPPAPTVLLLLQILDMLELPQLLPLVMVEETETQLRALSSNPVLDSCLLHINCGESFIITFVIFQNL